MAIVKNITTWLPLGGVGSVVNVGTCFLVDQSGNFLLDQSKNFLNTTPLVVQPKNVTVWTASVSN